MKYRKKPVVIEAFQITPETRASNEDWPVWLHQAWQKNFDEPGAFYPLAGALVITTLEGTHVVSLDDYIIQGIKGELYPCKPDIFASTYEPVE